LDIGLFHEDGTDAIAEDLHVGFGKMLTPHELRDPLVRVEPGHSEVGECVVLGFRKDRKDSLSRFLRGVTMD
jgi:hypothetical protein